MLFLFYLVDCLIELSVGTHVPLTCWRPELQSEHAMHIVVVLCSFLARYLFRSCVFFLNLCLSSVLLKLCHNRLMPCGTTLRERPNLRFSQIVIDAELLGFVYHWGLDVNSITVIGEAHDAVLQQDYTRGRELIHGLVLPAARRLSQHQGQFCVACNSGLRLSAEIPYA